MILHTVVPMHLILEGKEEEANQIEINLANGRTLILEPLGFSQAKLIRLVSSDPKDYLDPRFQPGRILNIQM